MSRKHILPALLCLPGVLRCATLPVPNNSFEDGALPGDRIADGWYLWEKHPGRTEVVSVPDGAHGRTSIRVANPSAGGANITVPGGVPCRGGATYTLSAWARSDGPVAAAITLQVRDRDGQVLDHTLGGSVGLPGQVPLWTRFTMTAAVPEAGCFLSPHLVNNGGVVLWDAVQIEEGPAATPFQPTPRPSLSLATGAGGEPVIVNPGFEEGDAFPAGWEGPAEAAAARDTEVKRGAAALRLLQADTPQPWRSRPFRLDPDRDYVLSAWVRSRELDRGVAEFYVECLSPWGRVCGMIGKGKAYREAAGVFVSQTTDWQRRSARVGREDIPAGSVAGRAVCVLQPYAAGGGMAWFDDLECRPLGITGRGVLLAAGSPVEDFLLDQGSPASLAFRLYAPERRLETARMSCRVRGFFERTVLEEAVSGVFGEDGRTVLEVRLPEGLPSGHYTAVLRDADASGTVGTLTFGVLPPGIAGAGLEPDSPYGICHLTEAAFLPLAQRVGFKWTRGGPGVPWAGVEPTPGSFDFSAALAWREQLARHGLLKLDICSGIPRWALQELEGVVVVRGGRSRRSRAGLSLPRDLEAWGRYIETAARTLSGFGGAWEIWNEADIPGFWADSDENYLRLLRAGHAAAKRGDPKAPLLMTGVTGGFFPATQTRLDPQTGREVNPGRFFERVLAEAGDAFDVINFHSYGGAELLEARLQKARELAARHALADRPIWITETGGPTHIQSRSFSEAEQAILYLQTHVLARAYGVRKVFWHCFYDWGRDITYHEHNFGLIHYDRTPKPALLVQAALARWFGAPAFVRTRSLEDGVRCFEFEREGAPLAVLWSAAPRVLLLRTAGEPEARDCMGAEMLLPRVGEVPVLALAAEPVFLLGARIEGVLPPLVTPGAHTLSPGETGAIPVSWRNPADHPLRFPVRLVPPPAWKARPGEMHLALDPGAHATDTISVSVPEAARPGTYELAGEIRSGPVPLRLVLGHLRVVLPVAAPRVLPLRIDGELGEWGELGPAIGPDAVAVGTVADAADLSAEARFSWCAAGLLLAVRVADQVVANPNRMTKPWVGDAVEVFVDARPPEQRASPDAAGVRQYFLVPPTPDCPRASWFQARPEAPADGPLFVAGRVLADGYAIEALLPWPADAPPPGPGTGVYLNLAVDDLDEPPGADDTNADLRRKGQIVWSGGADVYRNAAAHVLARLEPSPTGGQRDAAAGPAIETGPEDLPFNGDMDTDVNRDGLFSDADGWGRLAAWGPENGSATWAPDGGLDGSGALRLAAVSNLLAWQSVRYPLRRQAGAHRVEARVRASGLGDGVAAVKLAFYALDGHWIGTPGYAAGQTTGDTSGQWAALDFTVPAADVPAGAAFWRVVCQVKGPAPRAEVLYDRIRVTVRHEPDPLLNHE